jgi:acetoin utilization deacetylase AcuC-like enzyme
MRIITHEQCAGYSHPGHPERPERISSTIKVLRAQSEVSLEWVAPIPAKSDRCSGRIPRTIWPAWTKPKDFDVDTPFVPQLKDYALASTGAALQALEAARRGETVFSLMRPPGHHATRTRAMGFCYLNNIAIAVLEALALGSKKVAVYDFDVHHGNGTEAILLNKPGAEFFSIPPVSVLSGDRNTQRRE